jgi:hypothetical protein
LIVKVLSSLEIVTANEVLCEKAESFKWLTAGTVKACFMKETTVIDTQNVPVGPRDDTILGLTFTLNKKVSFLPV